MLSRTQASIVRAYLKEYEGVTDDWCPDWIDYAILLTTLREVLDEHDSQLWRDESLNEAFKREDRP